MTVNHISEKFGISKNTVMTTKYNYNCSYENLYKIYNERLKIVSKCQDLCIEIQPAEIKSCFNGSNKNKLNQAWYFLNRSLYYNYCMPKKAKVDRCKSIINYLESKND